MINIPPIPPHLSYFYSECTALGEKFAYLYCIVVEFDKDGLLRLAFVMLEVIWIQRLQILCSKQLGGFVRALSGASRDLR